MQIDIPNVEKAVIHSPGRQPLLAQRSKFTTLGKTDWARVKTFVKTWLCNIGAISLYARVQLFSASAPLEWKRGDQAEPWISMRFRLTVSQSVKKLNPFCIFANSLDSASRAEPKRVEKNTWVGAGRGWRHAIVQTAPWRHGLNNVTAPASDS